VPDGVFLLNPAAFGEETLVLGLPVRAFYGNAYCCPFSSASSTPHPVLNHYEIALLFLKSTMQCNWKEIFESAFAFVFVTCNKAPVLEPY